MMPIAKPEEPTSQTPPVSPPDAPGKPLFRWIEMAANLAILVVAVLLSVVLVKKYLFPDSHVSQGPAVVEPGTPISVPGINWQEADKTLLLFLSENCHYCVESSPFYRRLAELSTKPGAPRVVVVFPGEAEAGRRFLSELEIPLATVVQASSRVTGVRATPTVLLVDRSGHVAASWRGKLSEKREKEILRHFTPS